jgi:galactokinase
MTPLERLLQNFCERFGAPCRLFRAPGRVNLIGEHTDYNGGFVFPIAINRYTWIAAARQEAEATTVASENVEQSHTFDHSPQARPTRTWTDYVQGVAVALQKRGLSIPGVKMNILSDIPIGSGLSSSAALETAAGYAYLSLAQHPIDLVQLALACQEAENEFVGTRCGIMDQYAACMGRDGSALLLDCRSLECRYAPLPQLAEIVIINTMVEHELAGSEYNARRAQCEQAVAKISERHREVTALRDVSLELLESEKQFLPAATYRRARHVVTENQRVLDAFAALEQQNFERFGELMVRSHMSLKDDYEVSCPELDIIVEHATKLEGVYGARMTGGGFGGCAVALVERSRVQPVSASIEAAYRDATGMTPEIYVCRAVGGVGEVQHGAT